MSAPTPQQIAVCSWSLKPSTPQELVSLLRQVGLTRIQLALDPLRDRAGAWGQTAEVLNAAGVTAVSGMFGTRGEDYTSLESIRKTGGIVPDAYWADNRKSAGEVFAIARSMGIRRVTFHAGFIPEPHDPSHATLVGRLRTLAELAETAGVILLLETGQETADDLWTFLDAVDRGNVGVNFDPANMILYDKGDPIAALRKLMPRVRQIHLKDAVRSVTAGQWGHEVPVGAGQVDWRAFVQVLVENRFTGDLVIEREGGAARVADVAQAKRYIGAMLS